MTKIISKTPSKEYDDNFDRIFRKKGATVKLYDVPNNTWIRLVEDEKSPPGAFPNCKGKELKFHHIDGAFSYCTDNSKEVFYVPAWAEVEVISDDK